ncbi:helix-turn-helix domain-containing protein [Kordia jejudonensis]|uniref:helix-turn-helix domain-containing protein n=1 Tax=Kordia jejudonensis TaxID=1348245 RepID=UPI0006295848|nr:helix-turn-helix domain-containing protein [Kordia jejudonensis]
MKKKLLFIVVTLCAICNYNTLAASNFQESNDLQSLTNTELIKQIDICLRSDIETTKHYIDILHERASKELNNLNSVKSYFYYAYAADVEGNYQKTLDYIYKALKIDLNLEETEFLLRVYSLRGKAHEQFGNDSLALMDFRTSLDISNKYDNDFGKSIAIANFGKLRRKANEYQQALAHYKTAHEIAMKPNYEKEIARINIIMGLGGTYLRLKQPDSALIYIDNGIKRSRDYGDLEGVSYFYVDYGIAYLLKKRYARALQYLENAEEIIKNFTNEKRLIEVYYYMAKCYYDLDAYEQSIVAIDKAIAIINEENKARAKEKAFIPYNYVDILKLLIKNHDQLNNTDELARYTKEFLKIEEQVAKKDAQIRNELYNFLTDAEVNKFEKIVSEQQTSIQQNKRFKFAFFIVIGILGAGFFLFYRNQRTKKVRFRELNMKIAALKYEQRLQSTKQTQPAQEEDASLPKKEVVITDKKVTAILEALKKFEQQEHYLDTNCNLRFVAKKVKTNATYLSKIINTDKGMSFNEYITDLRIQYTLKRLQTDPLFRAYSVKSIAQEVGYKSADSFTKHFKNYTKLYPSYYIKNLKKNI